MTDILTPAAGAPAAPAVPAAPAAGVVDPATGLPAAPAAAPAAAPVVPAAPAVQQPASATDQKTGVVTYEATGDVGLDLALEFFGGLGLAFESPEMQEAGKGNFSYLEAKIAALGDKAAGGEKYLALAKSAYERLQSTDVAAYEARRQVAFDAVGGEETWNQITEFVTANADPQELTDVKAALKQGGIVAQAMAKLLHERFLSASGTTVTPASATRQQATTPQGGAPLSRESYLTELEAIVQKVGSMNVNDSPQYKALRAKYANLK